MVSEGSRVFGEVDYSILFHDVTVEEGAKVRYSIVMPGAVIKKGADVEYAIIAEDAVIESGAKVGDCPENYADRDEWGIAVVGAEVIVGEGAKVAPKEMISENISKEGK